LPLGKNAKIGFSKAMSEGWLNIDKAAEGGPRIFRKVTILIFLFSYCFSQESHTRSRLRNNKRKISHGFHFTVENVEFDMMTISC